MKRTVISLITVAMLVAMMLPADIVAARGHRDRSPTATNQTIESQTSQYAVADLVADFDFEVDCSACGSKSIQFTDQSTGGVQPYTYDWDFGDDTRHSAGQNPAHSYASNGTYTVILTVTDKARPRNVDSESKTVTIGTPSEEKDVVVAGSVSPTGVVLSWPRCNDGCTANDATIIYAWLEASSNCTPGEDNTVELWVTFDVNRDKGPWCVVAVMDIYVYADDVPIYDEYTAAIGDLPGSGQWDRKIGDIIWPCGAELEIKNVHVQWMINDLDCVEDCKDYKPSKCWDTPGPFIVHTPLVADFDFNNVCFCNNITFTDTTTGGKEPYTSWYWDFGDGSNSTTQNPIHHYSSVGTYNVTLTVIDSDSPANIDSQGYDVTVYPNPTADAGADKEVCEGDSVVIGGSPTASNGTSPYNYSWSPATGLSNAHVANPSASPTGNTTYTVTVTDAHGCTGSDSVEVTVSPLPEAAFHASNTQPCANVAINFTDDSTGTYDEWFWNFGDGSNSTLKNPSHTYASAGNYTVSLKISNGCGSDTETKTLYITVLPLPNANFHASNTQPCANVAINFYDDSTGTYDEWFWNFGDGSNSTLKNPSHTYASAGNYTVSLKISNGCGSDTETKILYITVLPLPNANFHASNNITCAGTDIDFFDDSTGTYDEWFWNFGDGSNSTLENPSHTYASAGNYTVSLTISNGCRDDTETKENYITVQPSPIANFSADQTSGCAPLTVVFTDASTGNPTSWSWSFPGGNPSSVTGKGPHTVTYNSPGTYTVSLTVSNGCGDDIETKIGYITVGGPPTANFSGSPTSGCAPLTVVFTDASTGNPTSWSWTFGDGRTSNLENPSHTYATAGTYTVSLTISNGCGSDTETKIEYITVNPSPIAAFSGSPVSGCAPLTVVFTDASTGNPTSWSWTFGDGGTSTEQNPSHTYVTPGTYTVSLTVTNGCGEDTETKTGYIAAEDCAPVPPAAAGGGCPTTKYLTVDWEGNNTTRPLYSNNCLAVDLLGPSLDLSDSLFLEHGTHAPIVDERTYYLIVVRELEEIPPVPENYEAIVVLNVTPTDAEFNKDIFLTLGLNQTQLPQNVLNLTMAYYDDVNGLWERLDYKAGGPNGVAELTLSAPINHFSIYGVLAELGPTPTPPAHFIPSGLSITPSVEKIWKSITFVTKTGETVTITANIANDGGQEGTYNVVLKLNGQTVDTKTVTIGAGQSKQVTFIRSGLDYGQYDVDVAGLTDEFAVSRTIAWWLIILIIVAIGLIIWGVVWGRRRRRKAQQEA